MFPEAIVMMVASVTRLCPELGQLGSGWEADVALERLSPSAELLRVTGHRWPASLFTPRSWLVDSFVTVATDMCAYYLYIHPDVSFVSCRISKSVS